MTQDGRLHGTSAWRLDGAGRLRHNRLTRAAVLHPAQALLGLPQHSAVTPPFRRGPMPAQPASAPASVSPRDWWERPDRHYDSAGELWFAGRRVADLVAELGTPSYVYGAARITQNVTRLRRALDTLGVPTRLFYAMKSNRFAPLLRHMRTLGVGIDACSPGEVRHALDCGFEQEEISFTAGCLSRADHAALAGWPRLVINADSLSALRRFAEHRAGGEIGLRINPGTGVGYGDNPKLQYAGRRPSKFGVYADRFAEALALAERSGLQITRLHCHAGCGFLDAQLDQVEAVFAAVARFLDAAPEVDELNLGGGLGIPLREGERPLDLEAWAALVRRYFQRPGLRLAFEPGDYLVKDAGALLTEITQVEEKGGRVFVGVDAGFNLHPEPAFYALPLVPAPLRRSDAAAQPVTIAGNINEALDLWAEDIALPPLAEGEHLCWFNAGGYGAAMASNHCLRGGVVEHWVAPPREAVNLGEAQLSRINQGAWDALYGATDQLVWGSAPLPFLARFRDDVVARLRAPSRLLDAGVGEGRNLPFLIGCGADELHAIDASPRAVAKIPPDYAARVALRVGQLADSGFPDAHFDAITLLDTFETLPDAAVVLRELRRVLKPGGLLLCNTPGLDDGVAGLDMRALSDNAYLYRSRYYFRFVSPDEAVAMFAAAGFRVLRAEHCSWVEGAHPGFRDETHTHVSHVLLAERAAGAG
jgi:diaminopimelate decarboxylase